MTNEVSSAFQCETSLLLGCDGNFAIPFQRKQGIDPHLEMRRGKGAQTEVCRETPCSSRLGTAMLVNILSFIKGVKYPFTFQEGT